jgi:phage tail sheath protein FI
MGPGLENKEESQAKAQNLIAIANERRDCIACISPHRGDVVPDGFSFKSTDDMTDDVVEFFSTLASSSYAVFDSGYKYMYDRFNDAFRYIPCNGDIAGLMVRTSIDRYPWFSPAGQQRGIINNAVKLAYNPTKAQRDRLYVARVNPVITQSGLGTLLFGDKTALGYASAFDRINVRRLFLYVEQSLKSLADAQLFELNDEITRSNFVSVVEPFLADIQAKRGLYGYLVVCDESNNTPDIIDNNEFRADIYLQPTKSINYVTLTFVATRTGISFGEIAGTV